MALLELKGVQVYFDKKGSFLQSERKLHVLKNLDLSIEAGEIIALVGESGCGKTTTGKVITSLLKPSAGEVIYQGKPLWKGFRRYRFDNSSIQFIQQDSYAAFNPVKTIEQSLRDALRCADKKMSKKVADARIRELLDIIGLSPAEQYLYKYPHNLSGGQRQRLLMARAIAFQPKIIVADEPVSMIDVSLRVSILNLMSKLNEQFGISFIYITHDLSTARYIAKNGRICVMYLGQIVEMGSVEQVLSYPQHPYTRALIMAAPDLNNPENKPLPLKSMELYDLENRTEGCAFRNRCIFECEACAHGVQVKTVDGVMVRCNRAGDLE